MGDVTQASKKRSQYSVQRFCGRVMTTTANCGNAFNAREADSPKSWSRVIRQRMPLEQAAATSSLLDRALPPKASDCVASHAPLAQ